MNIHDMITMMEKDSMEYAKKKSTDHAITPYIALGNILGKIEVLMIELNLSDDQIEIFTDFVKQG